MSELQRQGTIEQPEIRVSARTAPVRPLVCLLPVTSAHTFAQHLQQRYGHQAIAREPEMAVQRPALPVTLRSHHHHTHVDFAPHLHLTISSHSPPPPSPTPFSSPLLPSSPAAWPRLEPLTLQRPIPILHSDALTLSLIKPLREHIQTEKQVQVLQRRDAIDVQVYRLQHYTQTDTHHLDAFVQRLVQRSDRLETVFTPGHRGSVSPSPMSEPPIPKAQPVPQVVQQSGATHSAEAIATATPESARLPSSPSAPRSVQVEPISSLDVNRLTEQVIQTLDRRLLAYRERMGRM